MSEPLSKGKGQEVGSSNPQAQRLIDLEQAVVKLQDEQTTVVKALDDAYKMIRSLVAQIARQNREH
jgi:hypothetical protein